MSAALLGVILAAGEGKRMRSPVPKAIQPLCGRPMISYLIDSLGSLGLDEIVVVVGASEAEVAAALASQPAGATPVRLARQPQPLGSGDAAAAGLAQVQGDAVVIIVPVDTPLLGAETLGHLLDAHGEAQVAATMLVTEREDPFGYGRVLRSPAGEVLGLVEEGDASAAERALREVGTSIYCFSLSPLRQALSQLRPDNAQGELYLTDVIGLMVAAGHRVGAMAAPAQEVMGVNDPEQLAAAEAVLRGRMR